MKKLIAACVIAAGIGLVGGSTLAQGYARGRTAASAAELRKFQKETLPLRDELASKELDLDEEYAKPASDPARVASLRKDIVDLQTRIQVAADKYGVTDGSSGAHEYADGGWGYHRGPAGRAYGWGGGYGCGGWGCGRGRGCGGWW